MTGHLGSGVVGNPELRNNVSYYPDNTTIIKELMYADTYKESIGSILIRIPDYDLRENIFITDINGLIRLNPKYNVGFVPVNNHKIERILKAEDLEMSKPINDELANKLLEEYISSSKQLENISNEKHI